ncbi:hemagglutinin/amebocyte aggregation factor-like [Dendronephthya gigantea]|uniref:hemagglutinin/amebocyte aggregation factor-like n=1 Tax=Dendronephthya gigantea TaxID=151771 RepID=UPI00106982A2|nr:hemagglutinin/amebocyte aggregation factor-like [Dendronephthya gigantea]
MAQVKLAILVLVFLAHTMSIKAGTNFDASWTHSCPSGQSISHISSVHSNRHEDRSWTWRCRNSPVIQSSCSWSGYVNLMDEIMLYQCSNGVIAGVESYHSNRHEDRRFKFECCETDCYNRTQCSWTPFVNDWDDFLSYDVPTNYYLVGAFSIHSNSKEDRRWRFLVC